MHVSRRNCATDKRWRCQLALPPWMRCSPLWTAGTPTSSLCMAARASGDGHNRPGLALRTRVLSAPTDCALPRRPRDAIGPRVTIPTSWHARGSPSCTSWCDFGACLLRRRARCLTGAAACGEQALANRAQTLLASTESKQQRRGMRGMWRAWRTATTEGCCDPTVEAVTFMLCSALHKQGHKYVCGSSVSLARWCALAARSR